MKPDSPARKPGDETAGHAPDALAACCAPVRFCGGSGALLPLLSSPRPRHDPPADGMVLLPGGTFLTGTDDTEDFPSDGEGPVRSMRLKPFLIDVCAVTNDAFARFVDDTGHVTEAERLGWSYVFAGFLPAALRRGAARTAITPDSTRGHAGFRCARSA
ncbi:SUMF1/EgtB/PvdO family nonheme iron enzyme [Streptomyces sp. NBC_00250]|uniref:SUMF1/EgtB/PvdO family nonheme iron enzyme n=1 Tax=Streptomyces sp. NBC_00250 TaxID=2903641 RepID=UPI003FA734FB